MRFGHPAANTEAYRLFLLALVLSGLCALLRVLPADDVFGRYAPAAEVFARGDWQYAFHPRFGVYFTAFAGIWVWMFHCSGTAACQIAGILFFSLTVFPLYALFQKVWDRPTAFWGTLCYVFCSHLLRYAGDGVRDNGKTLALALMAFSLVSLRDKPSWKNVLIFSSGSALLTVLRGEGFLIAAACGAAAIFLLRDWKKSLGGICLFFVLIAPQCLYNMRTIGCFVPELHHGIILKKMGIPPADAPVRIPETAR